MISKKIKISFFIHTLTAGGAQRIMSYLAQNIDNNKFDVTLVIIGFKKDNVYDISGIKQVYFNKNRIIQSINDIIKYLKVNKPDIVFSCIVHVNTLMAFISVLLPKIKFVARVANVLSELKNYEDSSKIYFPKILKVLAYKLVDHLICQSEDMYYDMVKNYSVSKGKLTLINNPITQDFQIKPKTKKNQKPLKFITIARLSKEKGHERIINLLSKLDFDFIYTIIGKGKEMEFLFDLIKSNGLDSKINYIEYTKEIEYYLSLSDIYLQGSYVEGLPNAVIESCAVGTPVIAFNAPGGINEIITNGVNGYVVNTENEYINCLNELYKDFTFIPEEVSHVVHTKFNAKKIIKKYEDLFQNIINK